MNGLRTLDDLVSDWLEAQMQGRNVTLEELCAARPELLEPLRERLAKLERIASFLDTPTSDATPTTNVRLAHYRLLRKLGEGGMGVVWEAEDTALRRRVALKTLKPELAADVAARERFLREARAMAAVEHERIIPIHQVDEGEMDGRPVPFLAMPLLKGETLADRLCRQPRPPLSDVLRIGREIAEGLTAAQAAGLVHRDVKPANVWLKAPAEPGGVERVLLLDFGLVRTLSADSVVSQPGFVVGTPPYMAPEQASGGAVDARADLFSLGCVLYEMTTGRRPFPGPDPMVQVLTHDPRPPDRESVVPVAWSGLVMQLLAKKPEDRPASARAVVEAIRALEAVGSAVTASLVVPRPARRARAPLLIAALLVLAVAGAGMGLWRPWVAQQAAPPVAQEELKGDLDVLIWEKDNPRRQDIRLGETGALPLKSGDQFYITAELNRPAYLYVLWIDTQGKVDPVYPWKAGHWEEGPEQEEPVKQLRRPEALDEYYEVPRGKPGMETLVLLARDARLERDTDLSALLGELPAQREDDLRAAVWFENGRVVTNDRPHRGGGERWKTKQSEDPVLRTQQRIREKLMPHFRYTRAVSFANQGR